MSDQVAGGGGLFILKIEGEGGGFIRSCREDVRKEEGGGIKYFCWGGGGAEMPTKIILSFSWGSMLISRSGQDL